MLAAEPAGDRSGSGPSGHGTLERQQQAWDRGVEPLLWTSIIRGCVQVVLWGWVPEGLGGMEEAVVAERVLQRLVRSLPQAGIAGGSVRGVSLQVGQAVAQLPDTTSGSTQPSGLMGQEQQGPQQQRQLEEEGEPGQGEQNLQQIHQGQLEQEVPPLELLQLHGTSCVGSSGAAKLMQMTPPAVSHCSGAVSRLATVRLLLHSPRPQPAHILVLAEQGGGDEGQQGMPYAQPPARLLREVAVELVGGPQEVELALGAGELAGAVGADGVGVLRVLMVGQEHSATEGPAAPPLVHWVAPPLLLLPDVAAQELCSLWERMKQEVEAEQGGEGAEPGSSAPPAGHSAGAQEALAGAEQQSSLWWSHMAPLLGDLAYVLGAGAQQGQAGEATGASSIRTALLPFLYDNDMEETASLLELHALQARQQQRAASASPATGPPSTRGPTAAAASRPRAKAPTARSGSHEAPFGDTPAPTPRAEDASSPIAAAAAGPMEPAAEPDTASTVRSCRQFLPILPLLLPQHFSPATLEAAYQSWRLVGLTANMLYVFVFSASVFLLMLLRCLASWAAGGGTRGPGSLEDAAPFERLPCTITHSVLNTLADVLGLAVLYAVVVRARARMQQEQRCCR